MSATGFEEGPAQFAAFDPQTLIGAFRSIGKDGPTYEILRLIDDQTAQIRILEAERDVAYDIVDILRDPGPDMAWTTR